MLPVILDLLKTNNDLELRSLTGFLRNLSRHAKDKNDMGEASFFGHKTWIGHIFVVSQKRIAEFLFVVATKVVNPLLLKLPADGRQKEPSSEVVVNICGALNNLVTSSMVAARDITYFDGLRKLSEIKNTQDNR